MERTEIIKNALNVLLSEFVTEKCAFVNYDCFSENGDILITAGKNINSKRHNEIRSEKEFSKFMRLLENRPSMTLTTFDEFDGSCEITYKPSKTAPNYAVHWKTNKEMVKECVEAVGEELYDQILVVLTINSYCIDKLMREGGEIHG